jgi:alginate O-acetyltransferase complex protein AlgI
MQLDHILLFTAGALIFAAACPRRWRTWALFIASVLILYALQPPLVIPALDFAFPTLTLLIGVGVWVLTTPNWRSINRDDAITLLLLVVIVIALSLTRYLGVQITPSRPPKIGLVTLWLVVAGGITALIGVGLSRITTDQSSEKSFTTTYWRVLLIGIVLIVLVFVVLKTPSLAQGAAGALRTLTGRDPSQAAANELNWLGFSYVAFRLIHLLRERQMGKLPALSLREHITYLIFFPSLTAGPIDRAERFVKDLRAEPTDDLLTAPRIGEGLRRVIEGLVKKFVIADLLALFSLNMMNAQEATSVGGLWLLLYAYAFRLYFDFGGYTDIAIGIGILLGVKLPENFDRPYLKNSITAFWQSWHKTLGDWVRFYVFSPLSRALLTRKWDATAAVLAAQLTTMVIIGLWHGVTWTFLIWGVWHGLGLFVHKLWSDRTRKRYLALKQQPRRLQVWTLIGVLLTFHFVLLGWVWFAVADLDLALQTFGRLFGIGF